MNQELSIWSKYISVLYYHTKIQYMFFFYRQLIRNGITSIDTTSFSGLSSLVEM